MFKNKLITLLSDHHFDPLARWRRVTLAFGFVGWIGRWLLIAYVLSDMVESFSFSALFDLFFEKGPIYVIGFVGFTLMKWLGWGLSGIGYAHHAAQKAEPHTSS